MTAQRREEIFLVAFNLNFIVLGKDALEALEIGVGKCLKGLNLDVS
jgi:hypothetical protein